MYKSNSQLKLEARERLSGNWGSVILVCFIASIINSIASVSESITKLPFIPSYSIFNSIEFNASFSILSLILTGPLSLGLSIYILRFIRNEEVTTSTLFEGFNFFGKAFVANLLMGIFIALWSLLLVIPGIIAALSYSMTYYVMIDNPELSAIDAITKSKEMMKGHKGDLFCLGLSFIGWVILSCISFGIGFLWLAPYMEVSAAKFYENLKGEPREEDEYAKY